jgi:hypothetical protein
MVERRKYGSALGRDLYVTQLRLSRDQELALKEYASKHGLTISQAMREAIRIACSSK